MKLSDLNGDFGSGSGGNLPLAEKKPLHLSQLNREKDAISSIPDPVFDVAPAVGNFLLSGPRQVAADLFGATNPLLHGRPLTKDEYESGREKAIEATTIPETSTGKTISKVLGIPGEVVGKVVKTASELAFGKEKTKQIAPFAEAATDVLSTFGPIVGPHLFPGQEGISKGEQSTARIENKARSMLSKAFQRGSYGPGAVDVLEEQQKAKTAGQPYTLSDVENPELRSTLGHIYRQGGEARSIIKDFMEKRNVDQNARLRGQVREFFGNDDAVETVEALRTKRAETAKPLFDEAAAGGSTAPLTRQFELSYNDASVKEAEVVRSLREIQQRLTGAAAKQSQAGSVYSTSAANRSMRDVKKKVDEAAARLQQARVDKAAIHEKLQRAQADGSANAPGAVWSPRLQVMLDRPVIRRGLVRGYEMEADKAAGQGVPFNPKEYAIIGIDIHGEPIVGAVPNMRLLMVAKEGLDAMIHDEIDKQTGQLSKRGQSLIVLRDGFVNELDTLNPSYREARQVYEGDSASINAVLRGSHLLDTGRNAAFATDLEARRYIDELSPADLEFAKVGLAGDLLKKINEAVDTSDKSKKIINNDAARTRISYLFGEDAQRFIDNIERERVMRATPKDVYGGSQTAERTADDMRLAREAGTAAAAGALGHPLSAIYHSLRSVQELVNRPHPGRSAAAARLSVDPNIAIETSGKRVLPRREVPKRQRRAMSPIEGALIGAAGAQATDQ